MVSRIGPPPAHHNKPLGPRPPPSKAGDIPAQHDMDNFIKACIKGDSEEIRWFLRYYPHQWGVHCKGKIGLMFAAENGHEHTVKLLLELNSNINTVDQAGMTALLYATQAQHPKAVSLLLEKGAAPRAAENSGWTALHLAAKNGDTEVLEMLLAKAPDMLNKRNSDDLTPLRIAAVNGKDATVRFLLNRGASLGRDDKEYDTLVKAAQDSGHFDTTKMLKDEPQRRKELREAEIDAAIEGGLKQSFSVKGPMKLLKEKRKETPPEEKPADQKKETVNAFTLMQQGAAARRKAGSSRTH